jgi:hypothetical protein
VFFGVSKKVEKVAVEAGPNERVGSDLLQRPDQCIRQAPVDRPEDLSRL